MIERESDTHRQEAQLWKLSRFPCADWSWLQFWVLPAAMRLDLFLVEAPLLLRLWLRRGALRGGHSTLLSTSCSSSEINLCSVVLCQHLRWLVVLLTLWSFASLTPSLSSLSVYWWFLHLLLPPLSLLARYESLLLISQTSPSCSTLARCLSLSSLWSLPPISRCDDLLLSLISPWKLCLVFAALWKALWCGWESQQETSLPWSTWLCLLWGLICSGAPLPPNLTGTPLSLRTWPSISQTWLLSSCCLLVSSWKRTCLSGLSL